MPPWVAALLSLVLLVVAVVEVGRRILAPRLEPVVPVKELPLPDPTPVPPPSARTPAVPPRQAPARPSRMAPAPTRQKPVPLSPAPRDPPPSPAPPSPPVPRPAPAIAPPLPPTPTPGPVSPTGDPGDLAEPADAGETGDLAESALLELRLGRIASRTVEALRVGDEALIPASQFLELAEIAGSVTAAGRLSGVTQPGNVPFLLEMRGDTAVHGRARVLIPPRLKRLRTGELYVAAPQLARLFGVEARTDWPELEVTILNPDRLPIAVRLRREGARAALGRKEAELIGGVVIPPDQRWNGFLLDYTWFAPTSAPLESSSYSLVAGTGVLGGALQVGLSGVGLKGQAEMRFDASWLGVWRTSPWLKQLRLGDGLSTGPHSRTLRGVLLTNAPFLRPSRLGTIPYTERLLPGWEVEAYRGGELLAYDSVAGRGDFTLQVPVFYGENAMDFVAYGPHGQIRRFNRTFLAASSLLPKGRFEYGLSAGGCRIGYSCRATANLDFRYGVFRRWTVGAGLERFWLDTLQGLTNPYIGLTGSVGNAMTLELEGVSRALVRAGVTYARSRDFRLSADLTRYADSSHSLLAPPGLRLRAGASAFLRPDPRRDFLYFEASAQHLQGEFGNTDQARIGMAIPLSVVRLLPYLRVERRPELDGGHARGYPGFSAILLPRAGWGSLLQRTWVRGSLEWQDRGHLNSASLTLARPLTRQTQLQAGATWVRGSPRVFTLTLTSDFPWARSQTIATSAAGSPGYLSQLVQGSVLYDRVAGEVSLRPGPSLQRSGVAGRVFMDLDGNGRYDPGEPGLARVRIRVGGHSALSDSMGDYQIWDMVPFEPVWATVDSSSFDSPLWLPAWPGALVEPDPNGFTALDVPVMVGGILEGSVTAADGSAVDLGGITLTLIHRQTGTRQSVVTFTDGSFYIMNLRAGEYEVMVNQGALERRGLEAERQYITIEPTADGSSATLTIMLKHRPAGSSPGTR